MTYKIGFVGGGNMARAIIEGIISQRVAMPENISVIDHNKDKCDAFKNKGVKIFESYKDLSLWSDIIFLAVKPQNYDEVLASIKGYTKNKIIVSIAAGISTDYIKSRLGEESHVVRVMPNTPLLLGLGATAMCHVRPVTDNEFLTVKNIFEAGGTVEVLPEDKMNAVISVNSSSPAYVYLFAKAIVDGAVKQGFDRDTALRLVIKMFEGSAEMLKSSGNTPDELIKMVSSKGGTTIAALEELNKHNLEDAVCDAMNACTKRAQELGR